MTMERMLRTSNPDRLLMCRRLVDPTRRDVLNKAQVKLLHPGLAIGSKILNEAFSNCFVHHGNIDSYIVWHSSVDGNKDKQENSEVE